MNNENKYIVLDYLYNYNLELVKNYSESIYNSLNVGWQNFISCKDKNRCKKYKEKIELNLNKLEKKESNDISFINDTIACVEYLQKSELLNYKFKSTLIQNIKKIKSLSDYFRYILGKYDEIMDFAIRKEKYNKNADKIDMPTKIKMDEYYVIDKDGYYYYHVRMVKGTMIVVDSSLKAEKQKYKNAIKDNKEVFKEVDKNVKLSPFEKKRRIYIDNIFNLEKNINNLYEKKIDITYPIEKYYIYAKNIVDGLFLELNRHIDKNDIFDYIMKVTINNFNYEELTNIYAKCVKKFNQEYKKLDKIVTDEFKNEAIKLHEKIQYVDFYNIDGIVPTVGNIYSALNKKIITNLKNNYQDNHLKMDEYVKNCTKYMNEKDIIEFYREYKSILIVKVSYTECFINLQKSIVSVLNNKCHLDEDVIFRDYLKEDKIY